MLKRGRLFLDEKTEQEVRGERESVYSREDITYRTEGGGSSRVPLFYSSFYGLPAGGCSKGGGDLYGQNTPGGDTADLLQL